ncbi:MAG: hypothetical protein R6X34_11855 [Chloroflexota bacterium]
MTLRCKNCDQVILAADTVCWHCGRELEPTETPSQVQSGAAAEAEAVERSLTAVSVFALLTLMTILLLWLATQVLSRYPIIQLDPQAPVKPGWTAFVDHRSNFMLDLPPRWSWLEDETGAELAALTAALAEQPQYEAALAPLFWEAADMEVRLLAQPATPTDEAISGFVIVGESARLSRLTPTLIQALLKRGAENVQVEETAVSQDLHGHEMVTAVTQFTINNQTWQCQQYIIQSQTSNYIVAVCQPDNGSQDQAANSLVGSFQLFDPPK